MTLFADLPGTITLRRSNQHADFYTQNLEVVLVEQDLAPFGRIAGWVPVSARFGEVLDDLERGAFERFLESALDEIFRPWRYADRTGWPETTLFRRIERIELLARLAIWRFRAWRVRP